MDYRMALAWDETCGILVSKLYPLVDAIRNSMKEKEYGTSLNQIWTVLTCRPQDFKQKKQFKKGIKRLEYEILLDFYLIKHVKGLEKKELVCKQLIEITEQTFGKYKFEDFDTVTFLSDFRQIVNSTDWLQL